MALKIVRQMLAQEPESRRTLYCLFHNLLFEVEKHRRKHDESVSDEVQQLRLKLMPESMQQRVLDAKNN